MLIHQIISHMALIYRSVNSVSKMSVSSRLMDCTFYSCSSVLWLSAAVMNDDSRLPLLSGQYLMWFEVITYDVIVLSGSDKRQQAFNSDARLVCPGKNHVVFTVVTHYIKYWI